MTTDTTKTEQAGLEPCPFCGNPTPTSEYAGFCDPRYYVKCYDCGAVVHGCGNSPEHVADAWNRRPDHTRIVQALDGYHRAYGNRNDSKSIRLWDAAVSALASQGKGGGERQTTEQRDAARWRFCAERETFPRRFSGHNTFWYIIVGQEFQAETATGAVDRAMAALPHAPKAGEGA